MCTYAGFAIPPFIDVLQTTCSGFLSIGDVYERGLIEVYGIVLAFAGHSPTLSERWVWVRKGCTANRIGGAKAK
jgi:hypothetical protein